MHLGSAPTTSGIVLEVRQRRERIEMPIEDWLRCGPAGAAARPCAARLAPSGRRLPVRCGVVLRYRNSPILPLLIAVHLVPDPWQ